MPAGGSPLPRLPSLHALRAFEAAVRHRSITRAAVELCVTHGAVSRLVQQLEADLAAKLLHRLPRSVEPTPEGQRLAQPLSLAFDLMHKGVAEFRTRPLTLACSASIMQRWLIPRMAGFRARHPGVELRLSVSHGPVALEREGIDLALRTNGVPPPPDAVVRPLARERIGLVCTAGHAAELGLGGPRPDPARLASARLLCSASRPDAWEDWAEAVGPLPVPAAREVFEHFYLMLQAAACGLGLAVSPLMLVEDDLASGRLIAPWGFVESRRELQLWISASATDQPEALALAGWLESQGAT
jgi:DNA-binding transcriptional LysR family regulator